MKNSLHLSFFAIGYITSNLICLFWILIWYIFALPDPNTFVPFILIIILIHSFALIDHLFRNSTHRDQRGYVERYFEDFGAWLYPIYTKILNPHFFWILFDPKNPFHGVSTYPHHIPKIEMQMILVGELVRASYFIAFIPTILLISPSIWIRFLSFIGVFYLSSFVAYSQISYNFASGLFNSSLSRSTSMIGWIIFAAIFCLGILVQFTWQGFDQPLFYLGYLLLVISYPVTNHFDKIFHH